MKIQLFERHYGVHTPVKEPIEIPCNYSDVVKGEDNINEQLLLDNIPKEYLIGNVSDILLVADDTAQCDLTMFRNWSKYFDSYVLHLFKGE